MRSEIELDVFITLTRDPTTMNRSNQIKKILQVDHILKTRLQSKDFLFEIVKSLF